MWVIFANFYNLSTLPLEKVSTFLLLNDRKSKSKTVLTCAIMPVRQLLLTLATCLVFNDLIRTERIAIAFVSGTGTNYRGGGWKKGEGPIFLWMKKGGGGAKIFVHYKFRSDAT